MLHPAQKIASFFVAKKLIPAQDYEWAVYGLQRRLLAAVFYPILFLIGLLVSDVYSTVLFFVVFTSLRHRVGGHHAGSAMAASSGWGSGRCSMRRTSSRPRGTPVRRAFPTIMPG